MSERAPATSAKSTERVAVSCPGCGRHDWVSWPAGEATYHWRCFNCGKTFDLARKGGGH